MKVTTPCEGVEDDGDSLDDDTPFVHNRVWQAWRTDEWRTDFPPPAGFDGDEKGDWEDSEGYSRSLTGDELAALAAAGMIEPQPEPIAIEDDEKERDAFFASLCSPPSQGGVGGGSGISGVDTR